MAIRKDKSLSQTYLVARAKEVLQLSENKLIQVLKGETSLPERVVVTVALELYKRRIPTVQDGNTGSNSLMVIKIVKNHIPDKIQPEEIIDITKVDEFVDDKIKAINDKINEAKTKDDRRK